MQRMLATRNPREACMMNGMVNVVLYFPRYMMITGITVLALAFCMPELRAHGQAGLREAAADRADAVRAGRRRRLPAGRACWPRSCRISPPRINAAPAYIVNDIYKRFINPHSSARDATCA